MKLASIAEAQPDFAPFMAQRYKKYSKHLVFSLLKMLSPCILAPFCHIPPVNFSPMHHLYVLPKRTTGMGSCFTPTTELINLHFWHYPCLHWVLVYISQKRNKISHIVHRLTLKPFAKKMTISRILVIIIIYITRKLSFL